MKQQVSDLSQSPIGQNAGSIPEDRLRELSDTEDIWQSMTQEERSAFEAYLKTLED